MDNNALTLGERLFSSIGNNEYLQELYKKLTKCYLTFLIYKDKGIWTDKEITDLLRFSDVLSKSKGTDLAAAHKKMSLEISYILNEMFPDNNEIISALNSVLVEMGNFARLERNYKTGNFLEDLVFNFDKSQLEIPGDQEKWFTPEQKQIYTELQSRYTSYSAPTSVGKSFLMLTYIKQLLLNNANDNFAIIIPTKALINELKTKVISEISKLALKNRYSVITTPNDLALQKQSNFIFVVTPERLLRILKDNLFIKVNHLFIDEAYKISSDSRRSLYYYKLIDLALERDPQVQILFSSPFIPNPEIYLKTIADGIKDKQATETWLTCSSSPVSQVFYLINIPDGIVEFYNSIYERFTPIFKISNSVQLSALIKKIGDKKQNIIYCSSKAKAVSQAQNLGYYYEKIEDADLKEFAKEIREEVHNDYYLADLVEKGIGYHIGYLPHSIRFKMEELFSERKIHSIFCTSTLLEGVNLPIDNLFLTSYFNGTSQLTPLDFKNLVGRAGRIAFNLIGNVFLVFTGSNRREKPEIFKSILKRSVDKQELSIHKHFSPKEKEELVSYLTKGEETIPRTESKDDDYDFKRKTALILQNCIIHDKDSYVLEEFKDNLTPENIALIKENYSNPELEPLDDIDVSRDQLTPVQAKIKDGLKYPILNTGPGVANYELILSFLEELAEAYNWDLYEKETLGYKNEYGEHSKLSWYALILDPWMQGKGLKAIIRSDIKSRDKVAKECRKHRQQYGFNKEYDLKHYRHGFIRTDDGLRLYENGPSHNNIVISETLEVLNSVILFRLANYLSQFSEEYKRINELDSLENDWHDFVEFGTMNAVVIELQKFGFTRETARKLIKDQEKYLDIQVLGDVNQIHEIMIKPAVFSNTKSVMYQEAIDVKYNLPERFIEEEE